MLIGYQSKVNTAFIQRISMEVLIGQWITVMYWAIENNGQGVVKKEKSFFTGIQSRIVSQWENLNFKNSKRSR